MDVYCCKCGEPWDNDCLHEEAGLRGKGATYRSVAREFRAKGCAALREFGASPCERSERAVLVGAMYDLLGDDMDGASAMLEDFGW